MNDPTENVRREMVSKINGFVGSKEELEKKHGKVYDTHDLDELYEITGFMAPFVVVKRRFDNIKGTMIFQDNPRYYFSFREV